MRTKKKGKELFLRRRVKDSFLRGQLDADLAEKVSLAIKLSGVMWPLDCAKTWLPGVMDMRNANVSASINTYAG